MDKWFWIWLSVAIPLYVISLTVLGYAIAERNVGMIVLSAITCLTYIYMISTRLLNFSRWRKGKR